MNNKYIFENINPVRNMPRTIGVNMNISSELYQSHNIDIINMMKDQATKTLNIEYTNQMIKAMFDKHYGVRSLKNIRDFRGDRFDDEEFNINRFFSYVHNWLTTTYTRHNNYKFIVHPKVMINLYKNRYFEALNRYPENIEQFYGFELEYMHLPDIDEFCGDTYCIFTTKNWNDCEVNFDIKSDVYHANKLMATTTYMLTIPQHLIITDLVHGSEFNRYERSIVSDKALCIVSYGDDEPLDRSLEIIE